MSTQLFNGKTEDYEKGRPEISLDALEYLYSIIPSDAVFADVGAGTGKFTTLIVKRGNFVYAVEPNEEMRAVLEIKLQKYHNIKILDTCAESTGIPSKSIDVIVAVTALHWFDLNAFKKECHRILKPGGMVIAIYNSRKTELRKAANDPSAKMMTKEFFKGKCEVVEFPNPQYYPRDKYIAYRLSHSTAPRPGDQDYASVLKELNSNFDLNSIDGNYFLDFLTVMYIAKDFTADYPLTYDDKVKE